MHKMNKLTRDEWHDRMQAVNDARDIFIASGITNNISVAFELYQALLADRERPLVLSSKEQEAHTGPRFPAVGKRLTLDMDIELELPSCPDCGEELSLREASQEEQAEGARSVWYCSKCKFEGTSEKSPLQWIRELPEKGKEKVTVESNTEA